MSISPEWRLMFRVMIWVVTIMSKCIHPVFNPTLWDDSTKLLRDMKKMVGEE